MEIDYAAHHLYNKQQVVYSVFHLQISVQNYFVIRHNALLAGPQPGLAA